MGRHLTPQTFQLVFNPHGESNEGNESDEEETCQHPRTEASCLQGPDGQDNIWLEKERLHQEQAWQGREQETACLGSETTMDGRCDRSTEGVEHQGLCSGEEGHAIVQEGQRIDEVSCIECV